MQPRKFKVKGRREGLDAAADNYEIAGWKQDVGPEDSRSEAGGRGLDAAEIEGGRQAVGTIKVVQQPHGPF